MPGSVDDLIAILRGQVGVGESPPGSNVVILRDGTDLWRDFFGYQPPSRQAAWCALLQSWADWRNGTPLPAIDFARGYIGVDNGRAWFRSHGLLVPVPKPGYLAFYNEHTGRAITVLDKNGYFTSIEGNEGDAVRVVTRHISEVVGGFGVRDYSAAPLTQQEEDMPVEVVQPGQECTLPIKPWLKSAVIVTAEAGGGNCRVAIGGWTGPSKGPKDGAWPVIENVTAFPHRFGWSTDQYGKAEVVSVAVDPKSPKPVTVAVEYA